MAAMGHLPAHTGTAPSRHGRLHDFLLSTSLWHCFDFLSLAGFSRCYGNPFRKNEDFSTFGESVTTSCQNSPDYQRRHSLRSLFHGFLFSLWFLFSSRTSWIAHDTEGIVNMMLATEYCCEYSHSIFLYITIQSSSGDHLTSSPRLLSLSEFLLKT
mmetsp:Transcript_16373/g.30390  ORF Transcript_16373/g.30390 Transcript_16373/m.30390 type:complete len:156 (-) Transcript_16373:674-1141(-)